MQEHLQEWQKWSVVAALCWHFAELCWHSAELCWHSAALC
jgi:hypothetical protein